MKKKIPAFLAGLIVFAGCSGARPDLGVQNGQLLPCPNSPNCVSSQAADEEHVIEPIYFTGTQQQAHARLVHILESEKRIKVLIAEKNYLRAEFTSAVFRFVDDVELYFPEGRGGETIIHIRSASRIGYSDLGVNRKRIERIRNKF